MPPKYKNSSQLPIMDSHCFSNNVLSWAMFWMMIETLMLRERMVASSLSKSSGKLNSDR